jgi:hypothetical protein
MKHDIVLVPISKVNHKANISANVCGDFFDEIIDFLDKA